MPSSDYEMPFPSFAGFGIAGFRSFGSEEMQFVGPMSKVHLVVGQNNVGKSNVLTYAHAVLKSGGNEAARSLPTGRLDRPTEWSEGAKRGVAIGLRHTAEVRQAFDLAGSAGDLESLLATEAFSRGDEETLWFEFSVSGETEVGKELKADVGQLHRAMQQLASQNRRRPDLSEFALAYLHQSVSDPGANWVNIVDSWHPWQFVPPTVLVSGLRQISTDQAARSGAQDPKTGAGLIQQLAKLQQPEHETYATDRAKFERLNAFVASVLEDPSARIEVPGSQSTVLVHTRNAVLPIENLGTGISELIILAALATAGDPALFCIEEPETHLHPTLQRKLVSYLDAATDNRYLISTHSASLLNAGIGTVSHVTQLDKWSHIQSVSSPRGLAATAFDLGNRASDLVQSNFVIWVEGPSDRVYVLGWLRLADPSLIEGANFSIMFYGGGLLNHLAVEDGETEELISLLSINRNCAIIIDSDMKSASDNLNPTKLRVLAEVARYPRAVSWVTSGYTIENYVPRSLMLEALASEYPRLTYKLPTGAWASPLSKSFVGKASKPSKVMVARAVMRLGQSLRDWPDHVQVKTAELVTAIRESNLLD